MRKYDLFVSTRSTHNISKICRSGSPPPAISRPFSRLTSGKTAAPGIKMAYAKQNVLGIFTACLFGTYSRAKDEEHGKRALYQPPSPPPSPPILASIQQGESLPYSSSDLNDGNNKAKPSQMIKNAPKHECISAKKEKTRINSKFHSVHDCTPVLPGSHYLHTRTHLAHYTLARTSLYGNPQHKQYTACRP